MPYRLLVAKQLSRLFAALAHPKRIAIIEELHKRDLSVSELRELLDIPQTAVSQQLSVLRSLGLVTENKQGRLVLNHLRHEQLASWILDGLKFISPNPSEVEETLKAIESTKSVWG